MRNMRCIVTNGADSGIQKGIRRTTGRRPAAAVSYSRGRSHRVLCRYCGTENPGVHRFCGMCGREMEPEEGLAERVGEPAPARVAHERSESVRPAPASPATPAPAYTGGIFNLGAAAEQKSRNLDYL